MKPPAIAGGGPPARQAKPLGGWMDGWSTHPGTGADPQTVHHTFRMAELGHLWRQCDLFDDLIESDGHLRSLVEGRIGAVAGREWVIQPGAKDPASIKAAELLDASLRDAINFGDFLEHQLSATFYGFAASEIDWQLRDGAIVPVWFANAPHSRFVLDEFNELRLITKVGDTTGEPLAPGGWCVSRRRHKNLARAGLMRTAAWWAVFKRLSVRDWMIFAEKFGIPMILGVYAENASPEARSALEQAVEDVGEAGQAVLSEATKIVLHEVTQRSGDNQQLHPAVVALCESQMSKLINGSTLTSESGGPGSFALGKVHENRQFSLEVGDASRLGNVFRQYIGTTFLALNGFTGARAPRLKIQVMQEIDPLARAQIASIVVNELGAEIDGAHLLDELGFRRPLRPEDALKGRPLPAVLPPPRPAKARAPRASQLDLIESVAP